jgi:methionyl-tRNA synthetase
VYGQCKSWLESGDGLQPRAMTRDLDWGVPVPLPEAKGKVLYVWFDAPIGYISATRELLPEKWEHYWKNPDARLLHFIGKDNIVFHCIIFPAILKAHGGYVLPENVPANEFLNLENDKISTSRNWAVWLNEYLEEFPGKQDVLRYTLIANAPETKDNDFTWKDFQARNNNELVAILGNFVNRTLVLTGNYFEGKVPTDTVYTQSDDAVIEELRNAKVGIAKSLEAYRFREALAQVMDVARTGNKYLADTEPWKLIKKDPARTATVLRVSLEVAGFLSVVMEPFLPNSAERLRKMLNIERLPWNGTFEGKIFIPGHRLNTPELLFEKIEDDVIAQQVAKLNATKAVNANATVAGGSSAPVLKDSASFDDFTKMDLRIGTILEAERVPKTDKLLKLLIDTGIDRRTVVSGIAADFKPEDIIGQQVTLLANLEPRKIKGIESKGMILMTEDVNGKLVFVTPAKAVNNGVTVR